MSGIWNGLKKGLAALGSLAAASCATAPVADEGPKPAMWKLADHDTIIYLFGTIHILPQGVDWRTPQMEKAIAEADTLVLETKIDGDPMAAARTMMRMGSSPDLPPLAERVRPEKRAALEKLVAASGYPAAALDRLETWAAALVLTAGSFRQMGLTPEAGVERSLNASLGAGGKPVEGLETPEQQFGFFDSLSESSQRALLESVVDDPTKAKAQFEAMLAAWRRGDTDAIARTFNKEEAMTAELRDVLLKRRNAAWAEWLAKRLETPGTVFVAVGAGHLAGRDSVHDMLRARGLTTVRVQ